MSLSFLPRVMAERVTDLSAKWLTRQGVQLLMLDFDNTLIPYTTNEPTKAVLQWLVSVRQAGIVVCVVSNSRKRRVQDFCEKYGLACVTHANKPGKQGIRRCMALFSARPEQSMLVGDQIYTDVLGANRCGVRSVLVRSIHNHNFWLKARHVLEKPFIFAARKRRISL